MRICVTCKIQKDASEYTLAQRVCDSCRKEKIRLNGKVRYWKNPEKEREYKSKWRQTEKGTKVDLLAGARRRAKEKNLPFEIKAADIPPIPEYCPILKGIKLEKGLRGGLSTSPSLDRIDPKLGYVPGNIQVISNRANLLKNDGLLEEFEQLVEWIKSVKNS